MVAFDIIVIAILIYAFVRGAMKGFVMELAGLFGIVVSLFIAKNFGDMLMGRILTILGMNTEVSHVVSFFVIFLLAMVAVRFASILVNKLVNFAMLGWLNKLLGGLFSALKFLLIMSVMVYSFDKINGYVHFYSAEEIAKSQLYEPVKSMTRFVFPENSSAENSVGQMNDSSSSAE